MLRIFLGNFNKLKVMKNSTLFDFRIVTTVRMAFCVPGRILIRPKWTPTTLIRFTLALISLIDVHCSLDTATVHYWPMYKYDTHSKCDPRRNCCHWTCSNYDAIYKNVFDSLVVFFIAFCLLYCLLSHCRTETIPGNPSYKATMRLTITNVQSSDYGNYKCVAKNPRGDMDGNIKLYSKCRSNVCYLYFLILACKPLRKPAAKHDKLQGLT